MGVREWISEHAPELLMVIVLSPFLLLLVWALFFVPAPPTRHYVVHLMSGETVRAINCWADTSGTFHGGSGILHCNGQSFGPSAWRSYERIRVEP